MRYVHDSCFNLRLRSLYSPNVCCYRLWRNISSFWELSAGAPSATAVSFRVLFLIFCRVLPKASHDLADTIHDGWFAFSHSRSRIHCTAATLWRPRMDTLPSIVTNTLQLDLTVIWLLHIELRTLVNTAVYHGIAWLPLVFTLISLVPYVVSLPGLFDR